jgi:hypothetical protein
MKSPPDALLTVQTFVFLSGTLRPWYPALHTALRLSLTALVVDADAFHPDRITDYNIFCSVDTEVRKPRDVARPSREDSTKH